MTDLELLSLIYFLLDMGRRNLLTNSRWRRRVKDMDKLILIF